MPKLYYPTPAEVKGAQPLNEQLWFPRFQHLLLPLINSDFGRDLLCIDKLPYPIVEMRKNVVIFDVSKDMGPGMRRADFRVGAKWGNLVRSRWQEVKSALDSAILASILAWPRMDVRGLVLIGGGVELTVYPDPNVESTSVDGAVSMGVSDLSFANIRAAAGNAGYDSAPEVVVVVSAHDYTSSNYQTLDRGFFLFDTAALGANTNISAATFQFTSDGNKADSFVEAGGVDLVDSNPASNTAIVAGDYDAIGSTLQSDAGITVANITDNGSTYDTITLNATGLASISKTGVSKFGLRIDFDLDNNEPTWGGNLRSRVQVKSADAAGTGTDPKLVITYTVPSVPEGPRLASSLIAAGVI